MGLGAAAVTFALVLTAGCADRSDPRSPFLERWLEDHAPRWSASSRSEVARALLDAEQATGVDAFLLLAVVEEESRYDPSARSRKGARGLMQVRPSTAKSVAAAAGIPWSGVQDLDDSVKNVRIGAAYLAQLKERFGSWKVALSAYHAGPTRIRSIQRRRGKIPTRYSSRVLRRHRAIHKAYDGSGVPTGATASVFSGPKPRTMRFGGPGSFGARRLKHRSTSEFQPFEGTGEAWHSSCAPFAATGTRLGPPRR